MSDYRYRGISLSDGDAAAQGGIQYIHRGGARLGVWASSIADNGGDDVELDLVAGYGRSVAGFDVDLSVTGYVYPGARATDYGEVALSLGHKVGPADVLLGFAYAPSQKGTGHADNRYVYGDASWRVDGSPITLKGHIGRETGAFSATSGAKLDWLVGADAAIGPVTVSLAYVDTDIGDPGPTFGLADATVVVGATIGF